MTMEATVPKKWGINLGGVLVARGHLSPPARTWVDEI
jgi:hypothetical protein